MLFKEAIDNLKAGKFVGRNAWKAECGYLVFLPGLTHFLKVTTQPKPQVIPWAADIADSVSDDWAVYEPHFLEAAPHVQAVQESDAA